MSFKSLSADWRSVKSHFQSFLLGINGLDNNIIWQSGNETSPTNLGKISFPIPVNTPPVFSDASKVSPVASTPCYSKVHAPNIYPIHSNQSSRVGPLRFALSNRRRSGSIQLQSCTFRVSEHCTCSRYAKTQPLHVYRRGRLIDRSISKPAAAKSKIRILYDDRRVERGALSLTSKCANLPLRSSAAPK